MKNLRVPQRSPEKVSQISVSFIEQKYNVQQQIGRGSFAEVFKIQQKSDKNQYRAMKTIPINPLEDEQAETQLKKMKILKADNIIQFHGYIIEGNTLNIIMNYCQGNLKKQIQQKQNFTANQVISLIVQITSGMLKLGEKGIMHLDLKPENILCQQEGYYKICDFGCSQFFRQFSQIASRQTGRVKNLAFGTPLYISPEIQLNINEVSKSSCDVWSFGTILYYIVYGRHPFPLTKNGTIENSVIKDFMNKKYSIKFDKKSGYPIDIIELMLRPDVKNRITWSSIKEYLILHYHVFEAEFWSLEQAYDQQIKKSLVFSTVSEYISENIVANESGFWNNKKNELTKLNNIIVSLAYHDLRRFYTVFSFKIGSRLNNEKQTSLKFMMDIAKQEYDNLDDKLTFQRIQQQNTKKQFIQLLQNLQFSLTKAQQPNVNKLRTFIRQCLNILKVQQKQFFCAGNSLKETYTDFQIQQSDDEF